MEIIGAVVGVAIGWALHELVSVQLQSRRTKRDARFEVVREVMRLRKHPLRGQVFNEVPLFFGDTDEVMKHWRELSTLREPTDDAQVEALRKKSSTTEEKMIAAMVKEVGLEGLRNDGTLDNFISIVDYPISPERLAGCDSLSPKPQGQDIREQADG